ncbi:MAG: hypothetical protein JWN71_2953 [Xanthobacteraceae bacterium]|nr:hypothetical protein [Xanthobacteraceae bacterium]
MNLRGMDLSPPEREVLAGNVLPADVVASTHADQTMRSH